MGKWKLLTNKQAQQSWNKKLEGFEDCSPFQTFEWGQFHKQLGWEPLYYAHFNKEDKITALALGLLKRFPFKTGFVWCTGGPIGEIKTWDEGLTDAILDISDIKRVYLRFRCDRERNIRDALLLAHNKWQKPFFSMSSDFSMELDLSPDTEILLANASSKWRRNLRLSQKNDLVIKRTINPDIDEIRKAFAEMEKLKQLPELFSREKLESLFKNARAKLIFFRCEDKKGNLIAVRGTLFIGNRACDYIAASTEQGRKMRASFAVFWEMFLYCRERGINLYDLGGIDPWKNPGVYTFKRGTGAREVEYLGEWDWASSSFLRWFGNWAIMKRQTSKGDDAKPSKESNKVYGSAVRLIRGISSFLSSFGM